MLDKSLWRELLKRCRAAKRITFASFRVGLDMVERANSSHGQTWPAHATVADACGCAVRTVQRSLNQLRDVGLLFWQTDKCAWNRNRPNLYTLLTPSTFPPMAPRQERGKAKGTSSAKMSDGSPGQQLLALGVTEPPAELRRKLDMVAAQRRAVLQQQWENRRVKPQTLAGQSREPCRQGARPGGHNPGCGAGYSEHDPTG